MKDGILVGASFNQEWLLPWWWMNYRLHNDYPVTFINFGDMSEEALRWCQRRGKVITLDPADDFISRKKDVRPEDALLWESIHPDVWKVRLAWFKKPAAMLQTPYERTVWMDLDCQVRGSIEKLFATCENPAGLSVAPEPDWQQEKNLKRGMILPGETVYNSGVHVFGKDSPVMHAWAKDAKTKNHLYFGDQNLLIRIIFTLKLAFVPLSPLCNWTVDNGINPNALILHWSGRFKKILFDEVKFLHQQCQINLSFKDPSDLI